MTISQSTSISRSPRAASKALAASVVVALAAAPQASANGVDLVFAQAEMLAQLNAISAARQVIVLEGVLNGLPKGIIFALVERGETIGLDVGTLEQWRVAVGQRPTLEFDGRRFIAVAGLPGARANLEQKTQRVFISLPAELFVREAFTMDDRSAAPLAPRPLAGFLNYTFFGYSSSEQSFGSGFFEAGVSGSEGALIATAAANPQRIAGPNGHTFVRYDTAWRVDHRDGLQTLIVGDAITLPGAWGSSVRFGGMQFGTNFQLRPDLITYPLQAFSGAAVVPSTVDVFVNGNRIASQAVQPGPFAISNVPLVTGSGDVQLVVRDQFGQQQVISQPFYASRRLLRAGLDDYQVNVGALRENYGIESFDYGSLTTAGSWRRGLTDTTTGELRFEADDTVHAFGVTVDHRLGLLGVGTLGAVVSGGRAGAGHMWLAGYEYTGRRFNFGARTNVGSPDFRLVAQPETNNVQRQSYVSAGVNLGQAGSIGVAWGEQRRRDLPAFTTAALSYSTMLAGRAYLSASVSRSEGVVTTTSAFLSLSIPLDERTTVGAEASTTRTMGRDASFVGASAQRSAPSDQGFGYRVRATNQQQVDAGLGYRWQNGEYLVEASTYDGARAVRGTAMGGIGIVDGHSFLSRKIEDSFGIVRVGNVEGVRVFKDGNPVGRTDENGVVILPNLLAYSPNRITIEERDLPIDASVASRQTTIVPQYRSGALADYDVSRRQGAVLVIKMADGTFLPAGIELSSSSSRQSYISGESGEVFIPDVSGLTGFVATLRNGTSCRVDLGGRVPLKETIPVIGPLVCFPALP